MSDAKEELIEQIYEILGERDMPAYPIAAKEAGVGYTDYLTGAHDKGPFNYEPENASGGERNYVYTPKRNRLCSIGYHGECSDPEGEHCGCPCHPIAKLIREFV